VHNKALDVVGSMENQIGRWP